MSDRVHTRQRHVPLWAHTEAIQRSRALAVVNETLENMKVEPPFTDFGHGVRFAMERVREALESEVQFDG